MRQAIVRAAEAVFSRADFHEVLTDDIAAEAGIGKGTLYRYFRSKEELYLAAIGEGLEALHATVKNVLSQDTPLQETLRRLVHTLIDYFWHKRDFFVLMHRLEPKLKARERAAWQARRAEIVDMLRRMIDRAIATGEVGQIHSRLAAEALLGMIRGVCVYRADSDRPNELAETVLRLFLLGLHGARATVRRKQSAPVRAAH